MKNKIVLLFVLLPFCLFGQRFQGSSNLNLSFKGGNAIGGGIEYENLLRDNVSYYIGFTFLQATEPVKSDKARFNNFMGEIGGRYYVSKYAKLLPFAGISGFAGYEQFTNKEIIPESITFERGNKYVYGAGAEVGAEYSLGKWSLFASVQGKYDFSQRNFYILGNTGLKIYLE